MLCLEWLGAEWKGRFPFWWIFQNFNIHVFSQTGLDCDKKPSVGNTPKENIWFGLYLKLLALYRSGETRTFSKIKVSFWECCMQLSSPWWYKPLCKLWCPLSPASCFRQWCRVSGDAGHRLSEGSFRLRSERFGWTVAMLVGENEELRITALWDSVGIWLAIGVNPQVEQTCV